MKEYLELGQKIIEKGSWVVNPRTGVRCLTIINHSLEYNVGAGEFPLATTRKVPYKSAIAELIGYLRGYDNAAQFRALGTKTWDANANENKAWLANPHRKGTDDMGMAYRFRTLGYYLPSITKYAPYPTEQSLPTFPKIPPIFDSNEHQIVGKLYSSNTCGEFQVIKEYNQTGTQTKIFDIQFIKSGYVQKSVRKAEIQKGQVKDLFFPSVSGIACTGFPVSGDPSVVNMLKHIWNNMIYRCYVEHEQNIWWYKKVFVCDRWLVFSNFFEDLQQIPNWQLKLVFPEEYSLDKDWCNANYYSPETCRWATKTEQGRNTKTTHCLEVTSPNNETFYFKGLREFAKEFDLGKDLANKITTLLDNNCNPIKYKEWSINVLPSKSLTYFEEDQLKMVYAKLKLGIDDRGLVISAWHPHTFSRCCLRPCMYEHQFSVLDGTLHLTSTQRSVDFCLGLRANSNQCYVLLALMAQITGLKPGIARHNMVNIHVYEDQLEALQEELKREPYPAPKLVINQNIQSLRDIERWVTSDDFAVTDYLYHPPIKYPFTV